MAARVAAPRRSIAGIVLFVSVLIAGAAWYFRLPGAVVLWLGVMVVAWSEPPAILNGKKDQYGYPTAANPSEEGAIRRHRIWSGLRWRLVGFSDNRPSGIPVLGIPIRNVQRWLSFRRWQHSVAGDPNAPKGLLKRGLTWWGREGSSLHETSDWLPGWPVLGSWLGAIIAGIAGWLVPVNVELLHIPEWAAHLVSAVCLFSIIACIAGQARRNATDGPGCPGTRINSLVRMGGHPAAAAVILAGAVAAGGAAAWAALRFVPSTGDYAVTSRIPLAVVAAGVVVTLVITTPWRTTALAQWRELCRANREWTPRWQALKVDPAPTLIKRERVGLAVVDTFVASGGQGALAFWLLGPKINPTFGGDGVVGVMSVPSTDVEGQPVAGTKHSTRFQIAVWPPGAVPDLADPNTSEPEADLVLRAGSVWGLGLAGYGLPILIDKQRITADGSPGQAWATVWAFPDGGDWDSYRRDPNAPGLLAKGFSSEVLVDHRNPVDGAVYIGSLSDPSVEWSQEMPPPLCASWPEFFDQVRDEDNWNSMWGSTMKQGTNPPTPQYPVYAEAELADGSLVKRMPFMVRTGMTPSEFSGLEEKLSTSLGAAPFVAITGWPAQGDARPGDRHPMALTVYWSTSPVPARLDDLPPKRASAGSDANQWVIAGKMNAAFTNGRLARPEVISAKPLTSPASSKHIWKIAVRLYGGVTLAEVVGARRKLQEALGVTWLRVEPREQDGCVIYAGAPPASVKLLSPRRDELTLAALDWDQAFLDSGVTGAGGHLPRLTATDHLPHNTKVQVLDFRLPPGVDIEKMKAGIGKLRSATGNSFIEVRPGPSGASSIRLLVCEDDPMPERVSYDFGFSDAAGALPLATGVEGEPLTIDLREIPHLLVSGTSGGGKSVTGQGLMYASLAGGADIALIDVQKKGADFEFAKDRMVGFAKTVPEAAALMKAIYAEVHRRAELNAEYGAGSARDLPEGVRPNTLLVFIDEFLGVIMAGKKPSTQAEDDPEREAQRQEKIAMYNARKDIGFLTGRIAAEARSADVHLVLMTQRLIAAMLDDDLKDLKTNMARILLGKTNQGERMSALRDPENAPPLGDPVPKGRGIWESTLDAAKLAQFWFATPDVYRRELESRRPAVNAVDKIDLAPFMPKLPDPGDVAGSIIPSTGSTQDPDAVVELGEFTLDLMDLDDLDDEDEIEPSDTADDPTEPFMAGPADTEPGPVEYEVRDERRDAVLLLDVDGVLSPLGGPPSPRWQDWRSVDGFAAGSMAASGEMTGALCRLGAPMAWLTSWTDEAPLAFAGMMPEQMPILCRGASEYGWWKLDALAGYLDEHTDIRRIVWADDELNGEDDLGLPFSDIATELLDERGVAGLLLCPSADEGLSPDHLAEIDSWLDGETAQSERRETDAGENSPAEDALTQPVAEDRAEQQNSPAPNTIAWDAPLEEVCPADDPVSDRPAVDPTAGDGAVEDGGSQPGLDAAPAARDEFAAPTVKPKFVPSGPDPFV